MGLTTFLGDIGHLAPNLGLGGGAGALVVEDHAAVGIVVPVAVVGGGVAGKNVCFFPHPAAVQALVASSPLAVQQ